MDAVTFQRQNYVREYSIGGIFRATMQMYIKHFGVLILASIIPSLVIAIALVTIFYFLISSVGSLPEVPWLITYYLFTFFAYCISYAAITIMVSEICLGLKPSFTRSFKRIFGVGFAKLIYTLLLQTFLIIGGLLLLIVPGILFMLWSWLTVPVCVIENTAGFTSIRRSKSLIKGFVVQTISLLFFIICFYIMVSVLLVPILLVPVSLIDSGASSVFIFFVDQLCTLLFQSFVYPLLIIPGVLYYYDLRARKEGYNITSLTEDLQH